MSFYWTSGRVLIREVVFEADLKNISPVRIGAGREPPLGASADLAILRIRRERKEEAYIPGSSIKGLFRSHAEPVLRMKNPRIAPCSGLSKDNCMMVRENYESLHDRIQTLQRMGKTTEAMKLFFEKTCLLCKIFGAPSYAGRVIFQDAYLKSEASYGVRTGIAIDRRTGAVFRGQFYQVEYVEPDACFGFTLRARNLPNYALGLLSKLVFMMRDGELKVGGFKTRGFGTVTLENPTLTIINYRNNGADLEKLEDIDADVGLSDLASKTDGRWVISGDNAWSALKRLMEVWNSVNLS